MSDVVGDLDPGGGLLTVGSLAVRGGGVVGVII